MRPFILEDIVIYYYSATGNSRYAALTLGELLRTETADITAPETMAKGIEEGEAVGFVFPIYCWGVPPVVSRFIARMGKVIKKAGYVWGVCTCGDEAGIAMKMFSRMIKNQRGTEADASFSLIMPNTYVLLPGFDVDKKEVEERKLREAPARLQEIAQTIESGQRGFSDVVRGSLPSWRTRLFYPIFKKWGIFPGCWHVSDLCIGCGKCSHICPARNISMEEGRPAWGKNCYSCCACFHVCPEKAVSYGKMTRGKGQYLFKLKNEN